MGETDRPFSFVEPKAVRLPLYLLPHLVELAVDLDVERLTLHFTRSANLAEGYESNTQDVTLWQNLPHSSPRAKIALRRKADDDNGLADVLRHISQRSRRQIRNLHNNTLLVNALAEHVRVKLTGIENEHIFILLYY